MYKYLPAPSDVFTKSVDKQGQNVIGQWQIQGEMGPPPPPFSPNKAQVSIAFYLKFEDGPSIYCNNLLFQVVYIYVMLDITDVAFID